MCPKNASYYGNRAATLMMLYRYREALEDSQQAVRLDNDFMKVDCGKQTISRFNYENASKRLSTLVMSDVVEHFIVCNMQLFVPICFAFTFPQPTSIIALLINYNIFHHAVDNA